MKITYSISRVKYILHSSFFILHFGNAVILHSERSDHSSFFIKKGSPSFERLTV